MLELSKKWKERRKKYNFVIVGSGYGGAILAARISGAGGRPKKSVCILERGKEWKVGKFPDELHEVVRNIRHPKTNPFGLYDLPAFSDIAVIQGSGLGGGSLVNANVAIVPDEEVFRQVAWPGNITLGGLLPFYETARKMLGAVPHPRAHELLKVQALDRRAQEFDSNASALNLTVNFDLNGKNPYGVTQKPCTDCGDCVTGCNVGAKNTLYMNYLPLAHRNGTDIFTKSQVDFIQKLPEGGWRIFVRRFPGFLKPPVRETLEADHVILCAGALGTTEILLRSEAVAKLSLSPRVGTGFTGNGDFFGLAYNSDYQTNVLGFGTRKKHRKWKRNAPGPSIVGAIRYNGDTPFDQRITIEDLSFPSAYVSAAMIAFGALKGEDTDVGDEKEERARRHNVIGTPYRDHGAMNHTMLYLVMGHDDAKGTIHLKTNAANQLGRAEVDWDDVGRQAVFTRINDEVRQHARALGAHFISNPAWDFLNLRRLITAHPLGGCPLGEDYLHGAVDEFGRVFTGKGGVHEGLFVADGSLIPSALGVNPFLTISALSERIADRLVRHLRGEPYPKRPRRVSVSAIDPREVLNYKEADLERLFNRMETKDMGIMVNSGERRIDVRNNLIRNDTVWKGFFPRRHILERFASLFFAGFQKRFERTADGVSGVTSDSDGRIRVGNTLEEVRLEEKTGNLEAGKYVLLRYTDPPWSAYYDIFKVVNDDLLIGQVYLGEYPRGVRLFTFPMTRVYGLDNMTAADHRALYAESSAPTLNQLHGLWEMRMVANSGNTGTTAYLKFDLKPDGRLEARYRLMGLLEGMVEPVFARDHFQLNDFTPFHDEIRFVEKDFLIGKYAAISPPALQQLFGPKSLGLFHQEKSAGGTPQLTFYYTLRRSGLKDMPPTGFLQPLLNKRLPDGMGLIFEEEMVGDYFPGFTAPEDRAGDLQIEAKVPASGKPREGVKCSFQVHMRIDDLNEFIDSSEHEAQLEGTIHFGDFRGRKDVTFPVDKKKSLFNYLRINPQTREAEMVYRIYFRDQRKQEYLLHGRKYMQKDHRGGIIGLREILHDYTTLYCRLQKVSSRKDIGSGLLKFKTFENVQALGSFMDFLGSFRVTGTENPLLKAQGQIRFLAFTNQFILREYDPLNVEGDMTADEIREAVLRGAETPDFFSTRPTDELQKVMRETPTLPLKTLLNRGGVKIDYEKRRIWRDSFWKGSFAKDTLLGWEERIRNAGLGGSAQRTAARYAGGSFWKRFDEIEGDELKGRVVNYELHFLPGKPLVKRVRYPDNNRKYFKAGDDALLLTYTNEPYRIVYDLIKVIDENNCIGVMHLGKFPVGMEFATFVMSRHNYPFENMSVPDHKEIFGGDRVRVPSPAQITGSWEGHLIFLTRPDVSLLNQLNPVVFRLRFDQKAGGVEARFQFGIVSASKNVNLTGEEVRVLSSNGLRDEIRMIDNKTLIGRTVFGSKTAWLNNVSLRGALNGFLEPGKEEFSIHYLLTRV